MVMDTQEYTVVLAALRKRHQARLRPGETLQLTGELDLPWETLTLDVVKGPEVFRFEARVHAEDVGAHVASDLLLEFLDGVLQEWLAGGREAYPTLDFSPYTLRDVTVGLRGGLMRPDLDAAADAILAGANPHRNGDPHE